MGQEGSKDAKAGMVQVQNGANVQTASASNQKVSDAKTKYLTYNHYYSDQRGKNDLLNTDEQTGRVSGKRNAVPVDVEGEKREKDFRLEAATGSDRVMVTHSTKEIEGRKNKIEQMRPIEKEIVNMEMAAVTDRDRRSLQGNACDVNRRSWGTSIGIGTSSSKHVILAEQQVYMTSTLEDGIGDKPQLDISPDKPKLPNEVVHDTATPRREQMAENSQFYHTSYNLSSSYRLPTLHTLPKSDIERKLERHSKNVAALLNKAPATKAAPPPGGHEQCSDPREALAKTNCCKSKTWESVEYGTADQTVSNIVTEVCSIIFVIT